MWPRRRILVCACAQSNLGECYRGGEGVAKDKRMAVKWFRKAAAQGNEKAKEALRRLSEK